jgi:hypothetical protein
MRWKVLTTTAVLATALVAVTVAQTSYGRQLLRSVGLSEPREGFSELYFAHPATAGTQSVRDGARTRVSFVISNQQHVRDTYSWTVEAGSAAHAARGATSVDPGHRVTVEDRVIVNCARRAPTRVPIRVALAGRSESITEWVTCYG